jgi:hypothetical protein
VGSACEITHLSRLFIDGFEPDTSIRLYINKKKLTILIFYFIESDTGRLSKKRGGGTGRSGQKVYMTYHCQMVLPTSAAVMLSLPRGL